MDRTSADSIRNVDALARALYRRARLSGPDFSDIATVVRSLHTCLKHLRVEAEDPDSLLNTSQQEHSVYARHLGPIVEDCDFTLKQLDTILEKYGGSSADTPSDEAPPRDIIGTADSREKDMIALIRTKLANQKTNIDIFLDTVQLHNPTKARQFVDNPQSQQLDSIKDKVDAIAARLARRRAASNASGDLEEEELWQQFSAELAAEGFSSDVLMRNKEVLRAYIREMESNGLLDQDQPPSVRGLLPAAEGPTLRGGPPMSITPYPSDNRDDMSPKEVVSPQTAANEKFLPSVKLDRRPPNYSPEQPSAQRSPTDQISHNAQSYAQNQHNSPYGRYQRPAPGYDARGASSPGLGPNGRPRAFSEAIQPSRMSSSQYSLVMPQRQNSGSEYTQSDSDSTSSGSKKSLALISTRDLMQLDHTFSSMHLGPPQLPPPNYYSPGTSPFGPGGRYLPPPTPQENLLSQSPSSQASLPPYSSPASTTVSLANKSPPPAYGNAAGAQALQNQQRLYSRLQPDSAGNEIPLDATWTKIRRTLVSPEVLDRAGVRYEARPDFVAILGVYTREQIAQFARESEEVRRQRYKANGFAPPRFSRGSSSGLRYGGSRKDYHDEKSRSGSTSESDSALWDSDSSYDEGSRERERRPYGGRSSQGNNEKERQRSDAKENVKGDDAAEEKGTKVYPFIIPLAAAAAAKGLDGKTSSAGMVSPKPILKNRNENHVRFDREGPIEISPEELAADKRRREQQRRDRERERDRDRERERDRERRRRDREVYQRDRDRDRDRERERDRERDRRDPYGYTHRHSYSMDSRRHGHHSQGAEPSRDRDAARREKKKAWGQTLGAAGIGGAAASLLSVLTEAATGL